MPPSRVNSYHVETIDKNSGATQVIQVEAETEDEAIRIACSGTDKVAASVRRRRRISTKLTLAVSLLSLVVLSVGGILYSITSPKMKTAYFAGSVQGFERFATRYMEVLDKLWAEKQLAPDALRDSVAEGGFKFDVQKTESLVSPLVGIIVFNRESSSQDGTAGISALATAKETLTFAWQDGRWVYKSAVAEGKLIVWEPGKLDDTSQVKDVSAVDTNNADLKRAYEIVYSSRP